jgi:pyrimidine-nucleoside phosphorylase
VARGARGRGSAGGADPSWKPALRALELIERKRDGAEHAPGEIAWLVEGFVAGRVAPEQMSAWAMAVVFRGLSEAETHELTQTMVNSGATIDLSSLGRTVVDKHSTGGVGDKTTIALAPLAAAMGIPVAKLSGRGLAHTGGTLDKLEAIPGFRVALSVAELVEQVARIGCALAAQSDDLVPADRLLYALRDITGTVPAPGLIAASVMSKKLAAGADAILLDVKVGEGAFMPDLPSARELAVRMRAIGVRAGRPTVCELTAMESPLGAAVGNALEVAEACEMLAGRGPADFRELVLGSAARMAVLSDLDVDLHAGRRLAEEAVVSGAALRALERLVEAQGGDPRLAERPWDVLEAAPVVLAVPAPRAGSVARCGALAIGRSAMRLGAGRARKEDAIDHAVGLVVHAKPGAAVEAGEPLGHVHARDRAGAEQAAAEVLAAYELVDRPVERPPLVLETIG